MIIICPGIHSPELTQGFVEGLRSENLHSSNEFDLGKLDLLVFPSRNYSATSAVDILSFLWSNSPCSKKPVVFISFSAGVVGAIGAAWGWQVLGGKVGAFIALDGWGVPLSGDFPIYRLSHDYFTHWSSSLLDLSSKQVNFYAQPPVSHLELWRSPQNVQGWGVHLAGTHERLTAAQFILMVLKTVS